MSEHRQGAADAAQRQAAAAADAVAVPTVHGPPLLPGQGGWVDGHSHAWVTPPPGAPAEHLLPLEDMEQQLAGLRALAEAAGPRPGMLDCQPPLAGRDAGRLAALSRRSGVAIACLTGFHLARYYPGGRHPWRDGEAAAELFLREWRQGMSEWPDRRPAAIKAAHQGAWQGDDQAAWEGAIAAQRASGACLLVHTERGAGVTELLEQLRQRGLPPQRLYLCHMDKRPDLGLHLELAQAGVLLGYDTFLRPAYRPEEGVWPLLHGMVEAGWGGSVALGLDLATAALWRPPSPGPLGLVTVVAARLQRSFGDQGLLHGLLGDHLLLRLAVPPTPTAAQATTAETADATGQTRIQA